jgi:hypothetical protein
VGGELQRRSAASRRRGRGDEEGEDPLFLEAVAVSKKDTADKAQADAEEVAQAIAAVEELKAREAADNGGVIILDD